MSTDRPPANNSWTAATALFDAVDELVCGLDAEGRVVWLNTAARRLAAAHGMRASDTASKVLAEIVPFALDAGLVAAIASARTEGRSGQVEFIVPDTERAVRVRVVPLPLGVALVAKEVREDRRVQRVQLAYEARYQTLFNAVPLPLVAFDRATGRIRAVNAMALSLFASTATLIGTPMRDLVHPDERDQWQAAEGDVPEGRSSSTGHVTTWHLQRPTGDTIEAEVTLLNLEVEGEPARLAVIRDVTEARWAEANRLLLRAALAQINDLLMITSATPDAAGGYPIVFVNEAFERHTGWRSHELLGEPDSVLDGPDTDAHVADRLARARAVGEAVRVETVQYTRDGHGFAAELVVVPVRDHTGVHTHWVSVCRDISERKALQEQLLHSQKMEAVGRLAGGVAHDFNNVLTAISGFSELLLDELPTGESAHESVQQIHDAAGRAAALTRQLLAFSRKQIMRPQPVDVGALVRNMERLLARACTAEIALRFTIAEHRSRVLADPVQLEQVLLNLVVNGSEAMPAGGQLSIAVSDIVLDESYAHRHHDVTPGHYVCLAVSDSGTGMDRETRERVFEPFFSTKSGGTGLGLATVYGIVRQSGGHVWVYSEPGVGTTFKVYLPVADTLALAAEQDAADATLVDGGAAPSSALGAPRGNGETILVVEDEPLVRDVTKAMLARRGYEVLVASDGDEASRVAAHHPGVIHLLLTDVIMPRANGRRVAEQLRIVRPEVRVLYMSGYTEDAIVHHGVLESGIVLLEKPFTEPALLRVVRATLDAPATVPAAH